MAMVKDKEQGEEQPIYVHVDNAVVGYGDTAVVEDVDLAVRRGQILTLVDRYSLGAHFPVMFAQTAPLWDAYREARTFERFVATTSFTALAPQAYTAIMQTYFRSLVPVAFLCPKRVILFRFSNDIAELATLPPGEFKTAAVQARAVLARAGDRQTDGAGGRKRQDRPFDRLAFLEREHDRVSGCSHL